MNNKGFTLVELLAAVALIAIISLIITPTIANVIKNNKIESCKKVFTSVEQAAKNYVSDNRYNIKEAFNGCETISESTGCTIKASDLKSKGYITGDIKNPLVKNDKLKDNLKVKVRYDKTKKKYSYTLTPTASNTCK